MKKYYVLFPKTGRTLDEQKDCCERMAGAAEELYGDQANTLAEISCRSAWLIDTELGNELRSKAVAEAICEMQNADVIVISSNDYLYLVDPYYRALYTIARTFSSLDEKTVRVPCPFKPNRTESEENS